MSQTEHLKTVEDWEGYFASFASNLAPVVYDAGPSSAWTDADEHVHPEQTAWARQLRKAIQMPVANRVYTAVGYQLCTVTMVVGDTGLIIIDPGENDTAAAEAMADLRRFSALPIRAVVYTHRHPDHCYAIKGLGVTEEDVATGRVDVIAHKTFEPWIINDAGTLGPILGMRTSMAAIMAPGPEGFIHGGLGSGFTAGPTSTIMPTITIADAEELDLGGVKMTVFAAYGDAQDEIDLWFPDYAHVHGSETIQGETFPNLYTLRGTAYRDVTAWCGGVDALLGYAKQADSYSGSHLRSWRGNEFIVERITNYRDAIQYVYDQSVRHMNRGLTRDELVDAVKLPDHLLDDPWLQPYYGTVEHSVRNIYVGLLGWYQGDASELARPGFREVAARYVDALGGRQKLLDSARSAIATGDNGWAMELLTHVIRVDTDDLEARSLKAEAMRSWGFQQKNMYWRNLALGGAAELEGSIDYSRFFSFQPPDLLKVLPPTHFIKGLSTRLDPDAAGDFGATVAFEFPDVATSCSLEIRRKVAVFTDGTAPSADVTIVSLASSVRETIGQGRPLRELLDATETEIRGDRAVVDRVVACFDAPAQEPIRLVVR